MIKLSRLYTHPVKSMRGIRLSHTVASKSGVTFDRNFMITTPEGKFITARRYPQMLLFTPSMLNHGLYLQAPDGESATILYQDFENDQRPTEVWGNHFSAKIAPEAINQWLCRYFDQPVQLRWLSETLSRRVKTFPQIPLSFADGFPYLLINEASVQELQRRCPASIKLEQFRGNLIITGAPAFAEDSWQTIQIGEVIFDLVKPCSRCILTTVSPDKGIKHPDTEPLATLQTFRTDEHGEVDFGQNALALNSGIIRVGDTLKILTTKTAKHYLCKNKPAKIHNATSSLSSISITFNQQAYPANNQHVILEQLEDHGISVPYSCRAGVCGCCKIKLLKGQVTPLRENAINDDGRILACSCIPNGDITLEL
ncbi:YcbX family protein [Moellerella wisconsensis]|uniref:MOSC N-terminal beta barrel domain-containing protein n=1 Tax=Moellerella wisconsensis TaxID=158849 RepID=A0A9Q8V5L1_9GAMM|nr:MOSC N-terminal beta barrel domain-containing protein [Moellerella wisconsensis]UNH31746.1 MOSC N-terminal beta barrel domain-containing protein [Moellerella wisconsensis]